MRASMVRHPVSPISYLCLLAAFALGGCATGNMACAPGERSTVSDLLYFGMAKPRGGVVSPDEWDDFLRTVVTPRFPDGLTAWPASGQWRGADGRVVREDSRVLQLLHAADARSDAAIRDIIASYRERFDQEAVLRVRSRACASL
jgi:hypothetical protein